MFDTQIDVPYRKRGAGKKGSAILLSAESVLGVFGILIFSFLSQSNGRIAQRERVVPGEVTAIIDGRHPVANYQFSFDGMTRSGSDNCADLGLTVGGTTKIFVDPENPTKNGLRSFSYEGGIDRGMMWFSVLFAAVCGVLSAVLWWKVHADSAAAF